MIRSSTMGLWNSGRMLVLATMLAVLAGCGGGSDGSPGAQGPQGLPGQPGPTGTPGNALPSATSLNIVVTSVTINSAPVVNFTVTNQDNVAYAGITDSDLRFNIAKLIQGTGTDPGQWQNYIETATSSGAMRGSQERFRGRTTDIWGALVNHGDGTYTYTFETDITLGAANCPAPCTEADGTPLDLTYDPALVHRVSIQQGNSSLPQANAVYDFVPNTGPVASSGREIIMTGNCNECHDKITAHGSRFETKLCVTCHNPGTWADSNTPVDFKVMIHKIHRGKNLPSGAGYVVGSHDFSDIVFPQDIRNCTKCHDGSDPATPQGDNWQSVLSIEACGSCHDDIDFAQGPASPAGHPGGPVDKTTNCLGCHVAGQWAGPVALSHTVPGKAERAFFQYNILEICGTAVGSDPSCPPGTNPTVKFSVTDPTGATTHAYGNAYNVRSTSTDPEFSSSSASLNILVAWDTKDYTNEGGTGSAPSRADSVNLRTSTAVTDNADGTFTLNGAAVTPPVVIPATATGTGAIGMEGHPAAEGTVINLYNVQVPVNSEVAYFEIDEIGGVPKPRRQVVDVPTKCDRCHDVLNVHGSNRNNNGQLCVLCHNPSNTDVSKRPLTAGLPDPSLALDGKREESIDFKRLIHGIHSASVSNYDGTEAHGFRKQGLVVYGYNNSVNDFSHVRFPGVLSKCETCHLADTYTLADRSASGGGNWEYPVTNGIQGSSVHTYPGADPTTPDYDSLAIYSDELKARDDDYKYSPITSACSSCHDGALAKVHMSQNGGILGGDGSEQPLQESNAMAGNFEGCPVCHGPGRLADVKLVHDQAFADFLGEFIP